MRRRIRHAHERFSAFWWGDKGLSMILVLLVLWLLLLPFLDFLGGRILAAVFLSLLLFSGVTQISARLGTRVLAGATAAGVVALIWLREMHPESAPFTVASTIGITGFLGFLTLVLIGHVFREGPVTSYRIQGAVAAYLLIGLTWASLFRMVCVFLPGAVQIPAPLPGRPSHALEADLTYYSFVTLTTMGYGDMVPVHPAARMLAILEALIGQLFPATLLARLVSLQLLDRGR